MDLLSDVIALLRVQGAVYGQLELNGPFGFNFPPEVGHCIVVTHGQCFLTINGASAVAISAGDFVCSLQPQSLVLHSTQTVAEARNFNPQERVAYVEQRVLRFDGGAGAPVTLVTGCLQFAKGENNILLQHLPHVLYLRAIEQQSLHWYQSVIQLFASEVRQMHPGSEAIARRLVELLLVHALRRHYQTECSQNGPSWLRAMYVSKLGKALQLMHENPQTNWTVDTLAGAVHMSRSAFSAKFKDEVGITPIEHLTRWRMVKATRMIQDGEPPKLADIAYAVGYESESAFRKAFQRQLGVSPKAYRTRSAQERSF